MFCILQGKITMFLVYIHTLLVSVHHSTTAVVCGYVSWSSLWITVATLLRVVLETCNLIIIISIVIGSYFQVPVCLSNRNPITSTYTCESLITTFWGTKALYHLHMYNPLLSTSGLTLMGFKPRSKLKRHFYVKPSNFIHPDESVRDQSNQFIKRFLCE